MDKSSLDKVVVGALQRKFEVFLEVGLVPLRVGGVGMRGASLRSLSPSGGDKHDAIRGSG